jgi:hypothetical protein
MDAVVERNTRWDRKPKRDENGKPVKVTLTPRDIEIFRWLARYPLLSTDFILALLGEGDRQSLSKRLTLLQRRPNAYIFIPEEQRANAEANYRPRIFRLDGRGIEECRNRDIVARHPGHIANFEHKYLESQIAASVELGTRAASHCHLITWEAVQASDAFPEATRRQPDPLLIRYGNEPHDVIRPDWEPFVIAREDGDGTRYAFYVLEADTGTETLSPSKDAKKNTIRGKLTGYVKALERDIFHAHFGSRNPVILFITCSERRMQNMMRLLEDIIEEQGAHASIAKRFAFKHVPPFTAHKQVFETTGHMLLKPWKRACGVADYSMT